MALSKFSPSERIVRKRVAARLRQQRCRARKRQAMMEKRWTRSVSSDPSDSSDQATSASSSIGSSPPTSPARSLETTSTCSRISVEPTTGNHWPSPMYVPRSTSFRASDHNNRDQSPASSISTVSYEGPDPLPSTLVSPPDTVRQRRAAPTFSSFPAPSFPLYIPSLPSPSPTPSLAAPTMERSTDRWKEVDAVSAMLSLGKRESHKAGRTPPPPPPPPPRFSGCLSGPCYKTEPCYYDYYSQLYHGPYSHSPLPPPPSHAPLVRQQVLDQGYMV